jgi:hypothetical protein
MTQQTHPFIDPIIIHCKDTSKGIFIRKKNELSFEEIAFGDLSALTEDPYDVEVLVCKKERLPEYEYVGNLVNVKPIRNIEDVYGDVWVVDITNPTIAQTRNSSSLAKAHLCLAGLIYKSKEAATIKGMYILSLLGVTE